MNLSELRVSVKVPSEQISPLARAWVMRFSAKAVRAMVDVLLERLGEEFEPPRFPLDSGGGQVVDVRDRDVQAPGELGQGVPVKGLGLEAGVLPGRGEVLQAPRVGLEGQRGRGDDAVGGDDREDLLQRRGGLAAALLDVLLHAGLRHPLVGLDAVVGDRGGQGLSGDFHVLSPRLVVGRGSANRAGPDVAVRTRGGGRG